MNRARIGRIVAGVVAFGIVWLIISCSIESPKAPSWDLPITIPLIDRAYTSAELFEKINSENIEIDEEGSASFVINEELEPVGFESLLRFEEINERHTEEIGLIKIVPAGDQQAFYHLDDYVSLIAGEVPETGVTAIAAIGPPSTFTQADFAQGLLSLLVINGTGLVLDSVTIRLLDVDGEIVAVDIPGGLAVGEEYTTDISLVGKSINGALSLETYFHTEGGALLSLSEKSLNVALSYGEDLLVSSVTGQVDRFERLYNESTDIREESSILSAELESGELELNWSNDLPVALNLDLSFPEISNGSTTLELAVYLPALGQHNQVISLQGWQLQPVDNKLSVNVLASVESSNGGHVTISSQNSFSVEMTLSALEAARASAVLEPTDITWDETLVEVDIPTGFENLSPAVVELEIVVQNYSELSGSVQLELTASNGKSLNIPGEIAAGSVESPSISTVYSDQLADLLSPIPDQISVAGVALVGDGVSVIQLNKSDHLEASASIRAPMSIILAAATIEADANELEIGADLADKADRLLEGHFDGTITNHLPLGALISIHVAANENDVFANPLTVIGPFQVNAGMIDENGNVATATATQNQVTLSNDNLAVFRNEKLYIAPVIDLPGSDGEVIHLRAQDYLEINGVVTINARVGGEDF